MKVIRNILLVLACLIITIGVFSVIGYELYFRHAEPVLQSQPDPQSEATDTQPEETEPTPEPEVQEEEPSPELLRAGELLADLTLEQKVYQLFFATPEALTGVEAATVAGDATNEALLQNPVGGLLYSEKNLEDSKQVKALLSGTQDFLRDGGKLPAFLAIDEEGGDVAPVADKLDTTAFESVAEIGAGEDPQAAYAMGEAIAKELKMLGFNVNIAPIADLAGNDVIDTRAFSDDAAVAASMVSSAVRGTQKNGILSAVLHFPGLGSINDVAHIDRTHIDKTLEEMQAADLQPFAGAIENEVGFVVVSHAIWRGVDDQHPCSMSSSVMTMLREDMGFHGIILTDTLDIPAITDRYDPDDAALNALNAGADMLLCSEDLGEAVEAILKAVESGKLDEARIDESVQRILAAKIKLGLLS